MHAVSQPSFPLLNLQYVCRRIYVEQHKLSSASRAQCQQRCKYRDSLAIPVIWMAGS